MEEIICNKCDWSGDSTMLECSDEDFISNNEGVKFDRCPDCGSKDIEDLTAN